MTKSQYTLLAEEVTKKTSDLEETANSAASELKLSMTWVGHYHNLASDAPATIVLKGAYGCAVESISLLSFGLLRPAILSLRSHFELSLQYLYLRDHPRELQSWQDYRWQAPLPGALKKYLREHCPYFEGRLAKLQKVRCRDQEEIYGLLSAVAHGNAINSISLASQPIELVEKDSELAKSIKVFGAVSEFISDYYVSEFSNNWLSLPTEVQANLTERFDAKLPNKELGF
ncbi:MAG: hypothetical protein ABJ063_12120 [Marinomonas sp.]